MHSLDVWHKAKKLSKNLSNAAKDKDGKELKPWVEGIRNHFWYSCQVANGHVTKLKDSWFGVVHHVCNEHRWADSQCMHGPLMEIEPKTFLCKNAKSHENLKSVAFDSKLLANIGYYTKFRHTGAIENFNSMLTKYAPKRMAFDYVYFIGRMAMAAMDHNMHAFRPVARTKDGRNCYRRKYNKNTKKFHAQPVKIKKSYSHIPYCLAKIIAARQTKTDTVLERVVRMENDPKLISPNLDLINKAPPTSDLVMQRISRIA